jgi:hypothetical protein
MSAVLRATEEPANAQFYLDWNSFPREILQPPLVKAVNPP